MKSMFTRTAKVGTLPVINSFYCRECGKCCRSFIVHLNHFDIYRMMDNIGLHPRDFIQLVDADRDQDPEAFRCIYKRKCLALKHDLEYSCIFLKDNLCSIHTAKPGICRVWPLDYDHAGNLNWISEHMDFMLKNCAFKHVQEKDMTTAISDIQIYNVERKLFRELVAEWNRYYENELLAEEFVIEASAISFVDWMLQRRQDEEEKKTRMLEIDR